MAIKDETQEASGFMYSATNEETKEAAEAKAAKGNKAAVKAKAVAEAAAERGSDIGRTDEWRTSRNSGGCLLGRWSNSSGSTSSHHRPQRRGAHISQGGESVRKRTKI